MPQQNQHDRNRNTSGFGTHNHGRGPHISNTTPFSPYNHSQAPTLPGVTPTSSTMQRPSDPVEYDPAGVLQSTIHFWDDPIGIVHGIRRTSPPHSGRTYAQILRGGPHVQEAIDVQRKPERVDRTSQAVEPGGYNPNPRRDIAPRRLPPVHRPQYAVDGQAGRQVDFTPYLDPADVRNAVDLGRNSGGSQTASDVWRALGSKDANHKLRQETKEKIRLATSKRDAQKGESRPSSATSAATEVKLEAVFEVPQTSVKEACTMSTLVEKPSSLRVLEKSRERTSNEKGSSSPTLDLVRRMRAKAQKKTLAELERESKVNTTKAGFRGEHVRTLDNGSVRPGLKASKDCKALAATKEYIPDMELEFSDYDWAKPLYRLANAAMPPVSVKLVKQNRDLDAKRKSMAASVHSVDESDDRSEDKIDALAKAMTGMQVSQCLPSSPPEHRLIQHKSAVPKGLDFWKMSTKKKQSRELRAATDQTEIVDEGGKVKNASRTGTVLSLDEKAKTSVESFATTGSEDFERICTPVEEETEDNGPSRKWFQGFGR